MMKTRVGTGGWRSAATLVAVIGSLAVACEQGPEPSPASDLEADSSGSDSEEHEPESSCAQAPACEVEALCEATTCGGQTSSINHFGCTRPVCTSDADCPSEERCYPRAMGASCLSSTIDCEATSEGCQCATTNDCNGVLGAHCLPAEFYPVDGYCDVTVFECDELSSWHDALRAAGSHHEQAGAEQLAERLSSCSVEVLEARLSCGQSRCAVACELSSCPGVDAAACETACEATTLDPGALEALVVELATLLGPTCACDLCAEQDGCRDTWGC